VLRRWDGAIPIEREFRGIVWNTHLFAVGQYYHPIYFPELESMKDDIKDDVCKVHNELQNNLTDAGFTHFVIDFAWMGPGKVKVIEINPFDGVALGCFPGSTGLFHWDDEHDRNLIKNGPFELRMRTAPLPEHEMKNKLNAAWRDVIMPPKVGRGSSSAKPKAAPPPGPLPPPRAKKNQRGLG